MSTHSLLDLEATAQQPPAQPGAINYDELWSTYQTQQTNKLDILNQQQQGIEIQPTPGFVAKLYTTQPIDVNRTVADAQQGVNSGIKRAAVLSDTTNMPTTSNNSSTNKPNTSKLFLNLVGSSSIQPPAYNNSDGANDNIPDVHVPLSCSMPYADTDKTGQICLILDICVNTESINQVTAHNNRQTRTMLTEWALMACERKCGWVGSDVMPSIESVTYPKMRYKGADSSATPITHYIRKPAVAMVSEVKPSTTAVSDSSFVSNDKLLAVSVVEQTEKLAPPLVPTYTLAYKLKDGTVVDISNLPADERAAHIVATIELIDVTGIDDIDLTMTHNDILIESVDQSFTSLHIDLPVSVVYQKSAAQFSKKKHTLTLTMPIDRTEPAQQADVIATTPASKTRDWVTELALTNTLMYKLCLDG